MRAKVIKMKMMSKNKRHNCLEMKSKKTSTTHSQPLTTAQIRPSSIIRHTVLQKIIHPWLPYYFFCGFPRYRAD